MLFSPSYTYGRSIDILARESLCKNSTAYGHSTGKGIDHYLSVHKRPSSINMRSHRSIDIPLTDGMVFSDEPGFYVNGKFGIRLEIDMVVKNYTSPNEYGNSEERFLRFEILSRVPFKRNLIDWEMLTEAQKNWHNWYHTEVKNKHESTNQLNQDGLRYLREKTQRTVEISFLNIRFRFCFQ